MVAQIVQVAALEFRVGQLAAAEVRLLAVVEIASATAAFHRVADLVRAAALSAELVDLVEARLDPLVHAEGAVWVVVDLAVVEAAAAVAVEEAAAVDAAVVADGGKRNTYEIKTKYDDLNKIFPDDFRDRLRRGRPCAAGGD